MNRIEYVKFPEELNYVQAITDKELTIINTGYAYSDAEIISMPLSQLAKESLKGGC